MLDSNKLDPEQLGQKILAMRGAQYIGAGLPKTLKCHEIADMAVRMLTTGEANGHHPESEQVVREATAEGGST